MGSLTTAAKNGIVDGFSGSLWLALFTSATDDDGGGDELAGGDYARQLWTSDDPAVDGSASNTDPITFSNLPADTVVDGAFFDDEVAGTMQIHKPLPDPIDLVEGQDLTFDPGDVVVTAD